ncbi:hypothetical protein WOLCODRAFT_167265 [Wolfiporia cocos MD-104 SS10]|uniref:DUF6533 domain-containing protein n=1 Tax=Wolfiporia cocos (strain MD-104) TaxID=742152 RepID=A0A2H3JH30_WOLCO|nr:hypothetical protein WOLCODRAFT_167265 [Wolfiporia cocos MD-104 SS10]
MALDTPLSSGLLFTFLKDVHNIRYSELASSTIIIFDHLLTLDQEYELIWTSPWSLGKCLFLVNRYYTLITVIFNNYVLFSSPQSDTVSLNWYRWQGWTGVISFVIAELLLQLRLYALYFSDIKIVYFMVTCSLVASATSAGVMGTVLSKISATAHLIPGAPSFCSVSGIPKGFYAFWIPMLFSESVLCGLAVLRFLQQYRSRATFYQSGKHLVQELIRDSVFYFIVMFTVYLVNTLVFVLGTTAEVEIPIGFAVAFSCVMGNRLCLNVRGMIRRERGIVSTSQSSVIIPDLDSEDVSAVHTVEAGSHLSDIQLTELRRMRPGRLSTV